MMDRPTRIDHVASALAAEAVTDHNRRAQAGRGGTVYPIFWVAAALVVAALALTLPLDGRAATLLATLVFVGGGMPHGAYDIALLARATRLRPRALVAAVAGYVAVAGIMVGLWLVAPLLALILFLAVAAVHFGEDWTMLDEPLLKVAAGAAVIAAPAIGHPAEVSQLFVGMAGGPGGAVVARAMIAAAPVALLVTAVGVVVAWRNAAREWAAATAIALLMLIVAPPVAGFALFFVFLHSPRHLACARVVLHAMSRGQWLATGFGMSALAIGAWAVLATSLPRFLPVDVTAQAFQLLAAVALPHLVLSRWLERRAARD